MMVRDDRQTEPALISTKLRHRYDGETTVQRARLIARLSPLLSGPARVAAVEAPAGYGKSTLLSQWREHLTASGIASGWLSVEPADDDPARFLSYLTAALASLLPEFEPRLLPGLLAGNPLAIDFLIAEIIQAFVRDARPFVLFLDDYHYIKSPETHALVSRLIRATPPRMVFVIAGRHRTPLAFAELKLHGGLIEISPEELSFRDDEARSFLRDMQGIAIDDALLDALSSRAEGWIAGLQLAALALAHSDNAAEFIADFSGSDLDITNYLGEVVLDRLPEDEREFLLMTAVLGRMNASLCQQVTGRANSQRMLEAIASAHLFLRPLDRERKWYRYHQLFSDFLVARLESQRPGLKAALLDAASKWSMVHGFEFEAVDYAFQARDIARAAQLIATIAPDLARRRGEMHTVLEWVKRLPQAELNRHPQILLAKIWCLTFYRRWEEADAQMHALEQLEQQCAQGPEGILRTDTRSIRASLEMNRAIAFTVQDQFHLSREACARWLKDWPDGDAVDTAAVATALVYSSINTHEFEFGREQSCAARRACEACANYYAIGWNFSCLGLIALRQGHLREALRIYREGLAFVTHDGAAHSFMKSLLSIFLAEALYEADHTQEAQRFLTQARPFLNNHGTVEVAMAGYGTQAKLNALAGQYDEALAVLREAASLGQAAGLPRLTAAMLGEQVAVALRFGDWTGACAVSRETGLNPSGGGPRDADRREVVQEIRRLAHVRMLLHEGKSEQVLPTLTLDIASAKRSGRVRRLIELHIVKANALWLAGRSLEAQRELDSALGLAAPEGFVRVFIDEGTVTRDIVHARMLSRRPSADSPAPDATEQFLTTLAHAFAKAASTTDPSYLPLTPLNRDDGETTDAGETSALTRRERQLLKLIEAGRSNSDLAQLLFISEQTVKWHLHNLYRKLGVKSRTTAIARARKLSLL